MTSEADPTTDRSDRDAPTGKGGDASVLIQVLDVLLLACLALLGWRVYAGGGGVDMASGTLHGGQLLLAGALALVLYGARRGLARGRAIPHVLAGVMRALVGPAPDADADGERQGSRRLLWLGMGLTTLSVMLAELLMTRLFSVILHYHFAFMAISLALLGLGFSGILVYLLARRFPAERLYVQVAWLSVAAAIATALAAIAILRVDIVLEYSPGNFIELLRLYLIAFVPLLFSGLIVTLLFTHRSKLAGRLYFFDLTGAALAGPLLVPMSAWLGAPSAMVVAAAAMALGGAALAAMGRYRRGVLLTGALAAALLACAVIGHQTSLFDVRFAKGTEQSEVLFSRWNSFSRVAVYDRAHESWGLSPTFRGQVPESLWLDIDASASTPIIRIEPGTEVTDMPYFQAVLTAYGYWLRPGGHALVIGAGGGRDLLSALNHGFERVDGVEINGIIADDIMRGAFRKYSGNLYGHPNVHVHVDDGRSFVRRTDRRFDVIQLSLVDTWAATSAGAYMLSENNLYTVEAMVDYLQHLEDDGILSVARWPWGSLRMLSLFVEASRRLGLGDPRQSVVVLGHGSLVQMLFKNSPFAEDELWRLVHRTRGHGFAIHYMPAFDGFRQPDNRFARLLADPAGFIARAPKDLSAVTDDRPFFFNFEHVGQISQRLQRSRLLFGDGLGNLLSVLIITAVMVVLCFVVPMVVWFLRRRRAPAPVHREGGYAGWPARGGRMLLYFACLGFGFIVIEIVLIQKLTLLLGHPTISLVVSLSGILLGSGLGAGFIARRPASRAVSHARLALTAIIVAALLSTFLLQVLIGALASASLVSRVLAAFSVVVSLGFAMGIPLPLGIRILDRNPGDHELIPWAWGLNGALSVLGSGAAIFLAMFFGFNNAMRVGTLAYAIALLIALGLSDWSEAHGDGEGQGG